MKNEFREIVIPYVPRPAFLPFHERTQRWAVLVVHRRAGKTVAAINELVKSCLKSQRTAPRFAYVAPTYSQAKDVAWAYLKRFTAPLGGVASEGELHVTLPGDRRIRLYGADNFDRLRGIYLDGCVVDEPADLDPQAWTDILRPALSDRQGWCVWIGTPKGRDAFFRLWRDACGNPDWFTMLLPASKSGLMPSTELASAKQSMAASPGAYEREYECSFDTPVAGSLYGPTIVQARAAGRIRSFEWDRSAAVFTAWDIGWDDSTTVWLIQTIGRDLHWINHLSARHQNAADMLRAIDSLEIPITAHFCPHDADHHEKGTGLTYRDQMVKAGAKNVRTVPVCKSRGPGIDALRALLSRSWFRIPQCDAGLEALEAYHTKDVAEGANISREPVHDWSSHTADAARIFAEAVELGMVQGAASRRIADALPRYPDGSVVELAAVQHMRSRRRSGLAKSGEPNL